VAELETFPNPGARQVEVTSDRLTAVWPLSHQPDLYVLVVHYRPAKTCLETRSLRHYLGGFRNDEHFCEALAVRIRDGVASALGIATDAVETTLTQKARGGMTITASS
jgi:7-cyano-7-deazaguanine reductase